MRLNTEYLHELYIGDYKYITFSENFDNMTPLVLLQYTPLVLLHYTPLVFLHYTPLVFFTLVPFPLFEKEHTWHFVLKTKNCESSGHFVYIFRYQFQS